jgi:hypothetical protein
MLRGSAHVLREALRNRGLFSAPLHLGHYRDLAEKSVRRALKPTFAVLLGDQPADRGGGLQTPVLIPEAGDPDGIAAEIAAACKATRS